MISLLAFLACLVLLILNWATLLLALVVILQVILRGMQAKGPMDLDTFVCGYLWHPVVLLIEHRLQWGKWPRRRRGLAWLVFFVLVNAVLIVTHGLARCIQGWA